MLGWLWVPQQQSLLETSAEQDTEKHGHSCHMADTGISALLCSWLCLDVSAMPVCGWGESKVGRSHHALKGWG